MEGLAHIESGQLESIGRSVLEDFLQIPVTTVDQQRPAADGVGALVSINGSWSGIVEIRTSPALAQQIAATMFRLTSKQVDDGQLRDALDEVANIIGGNVKAVMPAPSKLSLPTFRDADAEAPVMDVQTRLVTEAGSLWIGVAALEL